MITSPTTHPVKRFLVNTRNMLRYYRDPLDYMTWMQRTYGKVSSSTIGNTTMYAFFTPEAVRAVLIEHTHSFSNREVNEPLVSILGDGLLTIDGDLHKQHRHLLLPAFHRKETIQNRVLVCRFRVFSDDWCAPSFVQRICCFFTKRLLITSFTVDSTNAVEMVSPLR